MDDKAYLDAFIRECALSQSAEGGAKFIGVETLVGILVYEGIKVALPEIKEWIKLGASYITMKRQEIRNRLISYAKDKELDFPEAEKAATAISDRINEENIGNIIGALEHGAGK